MNRSALIRAFVEGSPDALIAASGDGVIRYWNRGAETLFGYTSPEAETLPLFDLIAPADRAQEFRRIFARALRDGTASAESVCRRRDGSCLPVEILAYVLRGKSGAGGSVALIARDISARAVMHDSLLRLSSIVQQSDDAIISEDIRGVILTWNAGAARMYGYGEDEAVGRKITIVVPPDRRREPFEILRRIRRGERIERFRTVRRTKDGTPVQVSATISPLRDPRGSITGASLIVRDVTAEDLLREQLDEIGRRRAEDMGRFALLVQEAQEEERQRIARELHDDFGQRLTGLKLKLEALDDGVPGRITGDIEALIRDIKKVAADLRPAELDDFGLIPALENLCRDFEKTCRVAVSFRARPAAGCSRDVETALYRIAQEAFANVAAHARASAVTVELACEGNVLCLGIDDDGKGFDAPAPGAGGPPRRGLGLISMKERAQMFGGSLYLTSSPGKGTRVRVEIPLRGRGRP